MKRPLCSCGKPAEYSLCVLVSTLAVRPRRQKCGRARLLCVACIERLVAEHCGSNRASGVLESLRSVYTALLQISEPLVHPSDIRPGPALVSGGPDNLSAGDS